ncbi:hypothetical protein PSHT_10280 [Puccinia striiformis]|uniref:Glucosamine/galactosamine-6-phosphate isomerase domain-containing protein n=1 Tax=Puccinia striiformis TaxID=27350 RepID=A0A2S4VAQ8_9BASI|nr:hypothetical protein PSHT_10280 [Puccinia striiformis]
MAPAPSTTPHQQSIYALPKDQVARSLGDSVVKAQDKALSKRSRFTLAVSGGSLAKTLIDGLTGRDEVKCDRWVVFFVDERVVPLDHQDSNYRIPIPTRNLDESEDVAHIDYEKQLMNEFAGQARFVWKDLTWVFWFNDSRKPPSTRITLTYPVPNHASEMAYVAVGEGEKEVTHELLDQAAASQTEYIKADSHLRRNSNLIPSIVESAKEKRNKTDKPL